MYPPATPTALPPPQPTGLDAIDFSLWDAAPHAIQTWHMANTATTAIQVLILLFMILCIIMWLRNWLIPVIQEKMDTF